MDSVSHNYIQDLLYHGNYDETYVHSNDWNAILSMIVVSQPEIVCSKLTIETLEQDVKYVQS